jgi:hypothetical protein
MRRPSLTSPNIGTSSTTNGDTTDYLASQLASSSNRRSSLPGVNQEIVSVALGSLKMSAYQHTHSKVMPILSQEEIFRLYVQPRRAFLLFQVAYRSKQTSASWQPGHVKITSHCGCCHVDKWQLALRYHSMKGKGNMTLKAADIKSFFAWQRRPLKCLDIDFHTPRNRGIIMEN